MQALHMPHQNIGIEIDITWPLSKINPIFAEGLQIWDTIL